MNNIEILKKLVSFNTIKDKENDLLINFIEEYLKGFNFTTEKIGRCLTAKNGSNPSIGFIGHIDTVDYSSWDGNPFEVKVEGDKIIGLGVCDMKGGIAAILSALSKVNLNRNKLALYFTYDEEISFKGIKELKDEILPENIIIGEPTNNIPIYGTKGVFELEITFNGIKTHSSTPDKGKSAIYECINFISELKEFYEILKEDICNDFEVPYTSMNIGMIKGGETVNSVPGKCEITVDFRISKNRHIKYIEKNIKNIIKKYDASYEVKNIVNTKLNLKDISYIEEISCKKQTANYLTEASFINANAIIIGPGPITAHEKNEYITIDSLNKTEELYIEIIKRNQNMKRGE